jgi:hypothetical protein
MAKKPTTKSQPKKQAPVPEPTPEERYSELISFLQQNVESPYIQATSKVYPYNIAAQYYGDQMPQQYAAASDYARNLAESENPKALVDPAYYSAFKREIPLVISDYIPAYRQKSGVIQMPSPELYRQYMVDSGKNLKSIRENNFSSAALSEEEINNNLMNYWRDTLEHESGHVADSYVSFAKKQPVTYNTHDLSSIKNLGYMSQENHLVTGLGKVQREYYSQTGKRFESPEEFKNFLFDLAKAEDTEEAISRFSEEAKRTLRYQIENAKNIKSYQDDLNKWQNSTRFFRGAEPKIKGDLDLFEKSAELIPALVQVNDRQSLNA